MSEKPSRAWFYRVIGVDGENTSGKAPGPWFLTTDPSDFERVPGGYTFEVIQLAPVATEGEPVTISWKKGSPPTFKTFLLYNEADLYPVAGFRVTSDTEGDAYHLVPAGPEDGDPPCHPTPAGWVPTHWADLPEVPYNPPEEEGGEP